MLEPMIMLLLLTQNLSTGKKTELFLRYLDGLVGIRDEGDEEAEHHVDEEWYKGVEVDTAEHPHQRRLFLKLGECGKHVVSVHQREETLGHPA